MYKMFSFLLKEHLFRETNLMVMLISLAGFIVHIYKTSGISKEYLIFQVSLSDSLSIEKCKLISF